MDTSPFHVDELAAQRNAAVEGKGAAIRSQMPEQHRDFFQSLRYLLLSTVGADGWPGATMLSGVPGFVLAPDERRLCLSYPEASGDPVIEGFSLGQEIGLLGIDLANRRRNRANGRICVLEKNGVELAVRQSFGNCPKYIQRREARPLAREPAAIEWLSGLDQPARALIAAADTLFVASRSRSGIGAQGGADMSHRGGQPGFVRLDGDELWIPDFSGNRYFNTLGNLLGEPRAALLLVDFDSGDLLQLQGVAEIDWSADAARGFAGAERLWRFKVCRGWRRRAALPLLWTFIDQAPSTAQTGCWPTVA